MAQQHVTINNQKIPWSFIQKIRRVCGDWDTTIDAFWKARHAEGENAIVRYVAKGFRPDAKNNRYSMLPSRERNAGQMEAIRQWWRDEVYKPKTTRQPSQLKQIFADIAKAM